MSAFIAWIFFLTGFTATFNHTVLPALQDSLSLSYTAAASFEAAFFLGYLSFSPLAGRRLQCVGYRRAFMEGLVLSAFACLMFYPGGRLEIFAFFLLGNFLLGGGIAYMQVVGNPCALLMGSSETGAARLTFFQAFNAVGTVVAPFFAAFFLVMALGSKSFATPYLMIGALFLLGLIPLYGAKMDLRSESLSSEKQRPWRDPSVLWCFLGIFSYVGAEVAIGASLVRYLEQNEILGLSLSRGARLSMLFWGGFLLGRFYGAYLLRRFRTPSLLLVSAVAAFSCTVLAIVLDGLVAASCLLLVGLCNSIMFPAIFALGIEGAKCSSASASGAICVAHIGGALIPLSQGWMADTVSFRLSFVIPSLAYLAIALYSIVAKRLVSSASLKAA